MNHVHLKCLSSILLAVVALLGAPAADALEVGSYATRLTFPEGTPLGGDGDRRGRAAVGEHDPLWARCLYLDDGETVVYLVTLDLHHIPQALRAQVVGMTKGVVGRESIFLTATYTGNGPGGLEEEIPRRWANGRFQPALLKGLVQSVLDTMRGAREAAQRATLGYGTARQQVLSVNANTPDGPIDEQIGVIRVDNADGQALAILSNFAAIPRMVPSAQRYYFSADYPGAYYAALEALSDPGCIALFLPGACGGQKPGNPEKKTGWAAIESVGRLLAVRTKSVANKMSFRDVKLRTFYREVSLPPTVASAFCPTSTLLQAMALDDLLLVFLPGIPDVKVGLALRRQALNLGYADQFTVSSSNDYIMNIVSRDEFARETPESARHHYGPEMASWLYAQVNGMLKGADDGEGQSIPREDPTAQKEKFLASEQIKLTLEGEGYARGFQQGAAFAARIRTRYEERVLDAIRDGLVRPTDDLWPYWPAPLDATPVALPALAASLRPLLQGFDKDTFAALEGAAHGAAMPFDAFWLLQIGGAQGRGEKGGRWMQEPLGTEIAIVGDRAGAERAVLGVNLDWPWSDAPLVFSVKPAEGHPFLGMGFPWQLGIMTGMNDVGVSVSLVEAAPMDETGLSGLPIRLVLQDVLQRTATFDEALEHLRGFSHLKGGRVLLVAPGEDGWSAGIVNLGKGTRVRDPEDGLLLGVDIDREGTSDTTRERYQRVGNALVGERIIGVGELQRLLCDAGPKEAEHQRVWNDTTRYSVVMVPGTGTLHVALSGESHGVDPYTTYVLERGGRQ